MATLIRSDDASGGFGFIYWQPGASVARIKWVDSDRTEHERVLTDEASAVDLLLAVGTKPGARVVSCVVS